MTALRPRLSVIICTLDNAAVLDEALQSLAEQEFSESPDDFEILVIDNGSEDDTRTLVSGWVDRIRIPLRYDFFPDTGLSKARNRGIDLAAGQILAFLDDDARARGDWLCNLLKTFSQHPDVDAAGGPITAHGVTRLPEWLPPRLYTHISLLDYGPAPRRLKYPRYLFGTNMAVRCDALQRAGTFDTELGRRGSASMITGEETDLFLRLERSGGTILYQPSVVVSHRMRPERLRPGWIMNQSYWIGRSSAAIEKRSMPLWRVAARAAASAPLAVLGGVLYVCAGLFRARRLQLIGGCLGKNRLGYLVGMG